MYGTYYKPKKVSAAVILLWISLVLGSIRAIIEIMPTETMEALIGSIIAITLVTIVAILIYMIGKGKNWARITFLVLFIIGIALNIPALAISLFTNPILFVLRLGEITLTGIALVLLFQDVSSNWFRNFKSSF